MIDIKNMSVLIADDMENMYNSIRSIMRLLGFGKKFTYASNGEEALELLKRSGYDLALLDNNMPNMTGLELLSIIRSDPALEDLPVVMITAHAEQEFITQAAESNVDAYLLKPITVNLIKEKIPAVIENVNTPPPMVMYLKQAKRFRAEGDLNAAVGAALQAMEANPHSTRPMREVGGYLLEMGDFEEAERYLKQAADLNRLDVVAFNLLGDLYLQKDDVDSALKYFSRAMELSPRHYERGLSLGKILVQKNMLDKARQVFSKVFEVARNPFEVKEQVADFCISHDAGKYAAQLLKNLVDRLPDRVDLLVRLGVLSREIGDVAAAVRYLESAEDQDPNNIETKLNLAKCYIRQKQLIRAERPLKDVLKLDPNHEEARELLRGCI